MKIIEKEFNLQTGEETIIERDATSLEIAESKKVETEIAKKTVRFDEIAASKAALLEKLGITEEEAKLLLS